MTDLKKIEDILHSALELPESERRPFVERACDGDSELRHEVVSLLELDTEAENFIESPPDDIAADVISSRDTGSDIIGKTLDKYRVIKRIAAGGMGEVFLAEDTKLDRKVALKILPPQFSSDPERQLRFEQEAKAISALNHRNIITIYDIETVEGVNFMATEFVEGRTLREIIAAGPISWNDAVRISIDIASALSAAHSVGIIHRDIKPANVMVRRDGDVKVLDFGLAKLTASSGQSGSFDTRDHTAQNRVMGTISYMSPEQALGERLDSRTDIFSLGVVMYEMLSGVQPFAGPSEAAIYNATINKTPPPLALSSQGIPPELDRIIHKSLAKKAEERYQTAEALRYDLERLDRRSESSSFTSSSFLGGTEAKWWGKPLAVAALLLVVGAAVFLAFFDQKGGSAPAGSVRNFRFTQLTSDGESLMPSLSPDGKTVVFSSRRNGNWDVFYQRVGGSNAVNLTQGSKADDRDAVFSPDGEQIAFSSNREGASGIFLMGATGENVRKISDFGYSPAWSPDGSEIVFSTTAVDDPTDRYVYPAALWKVNIATGARVELTPSDAVQPSWSPSGNLIAFWSMDAAGIRDIKTISPTGGEPVHVTSDPDLDWNPVWSQDGDHIYFSSKRGGSMNFWKVRVDKSTGQPLSDPESFTTPSTFSQNLAFSSDGKVIAFAQQVNTSNIFKAEFDPRTEKLVGQPTVVSKSSRFDRNPSISPDGEWLAFDAIKDGQEDLFLMRPDGSSLLQLTNDKNKDRAPRWSPDGKQLAFYSDRSGRYETWLINPNGAGLQQITFDSEPHGLLTLWSPDGTKMIQSVSGKYPRIFDAIFPLTSHTAFQLPDEGDANLWEMAYSWSGDGKKIAQLRQAKNDPDVSGIAIFDIAANRQELVSAVGDAPVWLSDSRRLLFSDRNKIFLLDTETKKSKELIVFGPMDYVPGLTISSDDRTVYFPLQKKESNLWIGTME